MGIRINSFSKGILKYLLILSLNGKVLMSVSNVSYFKIPRIEELIGVSKKLVGFEHTFPCMTFSSFYIHMSSTLIDSPDFIKQ